MGLSVPLGLQREEAEEAKRRLSHLAGTKRKIGTPRSQRLWGKVRESVADMRDALDAPLRKIGAEHEMTSLTRGTSHTRSPEMGVIVEDPPADAEPAIETHALTGLQIHSAMESDDIRSRKTESTSAMESDDCPIRETEMTGAE
jgi:phosphoribosylanthranilate isomerase